MKTNIKDLPDEKLIELCAKAQGWKKDCRASTFGITCYWIDENGACDKCRDYNPLANTQAGKAQAMELVEVFDLIVGFSFTSYDDKFYFAQFGRFTNDRETATNLRRAIVLAVVASKYGDTVEYDGGEV